MRTQIENAIKRIERYRKTNRNAFRLARLASLAVRVEPCLLRRLRLELLPEADVGVEADLWFSPLVESRNAEAIVLNHHVVDVLREDLVTDRELFLQVKKITEASHVNAPPSIRLEENLNALALLNEGDVLTTINEALRPALRALKEGGDRAVEISHWVFRALPRFHPTVRKSPNALSLLLSAQLMLGSRILRETPDTNVAIQDVAWVLPEDALENRVSLSVELIEQGVRFFEAEPDAPAVDLPRTSPLLVGLAWKYHGERLEMLVEVEPGRTFDLESDVSAVTIKTLAGDEFLLEREETSGTVRPEVDLYEAPDNALENKIIQTQPAKVYISYSKSDEKSFNNLSDNLKDLEYKKVIEIWSVRQLSSGDLWKEKYWGALDSASIILLLVSSAYLASDYARDEINHAMELNGAGRAKVIPIILEECRWDETPVHKLQALPAGGRPVSLFKNENDAFYEISRSIAAIARDVASVEEAEYQYNSFTGSYEYDIFISYAHNDNHAPGDARGWVDQFHEWLESWLTKRRGMKKLSIWRDSRRMSGDLLFDGANREAVNRSALFFALVSRNYLSSEYCMDELNRFYQHNSATPAGLKIDDRYRIFTILLNNIPYDQYQQRSPALKGMTGFAFHDAASDSELGDFTSISEDRFQKQMRLLVDAVETTLALLATPQPSATVEEVASPANAVFMADVAENLQPLRNRLQAQIRARQGIVLPSVPPPWEFDAHGDEVRRILDKARFSIHLFGQWQGRTIIDRLETTYPREQFAIAKESSALPLVWVPPELDIETINNQAHRRFLLDCAEGAKQTGPYEFVQAPQSAFINLVLEKLNQPIFPGPMEPDRQTFLVDTHQKDQRYAFKLADYLTKRGMDVELNHEANDPLASREKFELAIRPVKNLIIMFGKVSPEWLQARIKLALKVVAEQFQSEQPSNLENIWVYKTPDSKDDPTLPPIPPIINIKILDNSHTPSIDPAVANQLLGASASADKNSIIGESNI